jgi:predicted acetyltransferase
VYERVRTRAGFIDRSDRSWQLVAGLLAGPGRPEPVHRFAVLLGADGAARGYARYRIRDGWDGGRPTATCAVPELLALTPGDEAALWRFCASIDWVRTVEADFRPPEDPVRWFLANPREWRETGRWDMTWARVLRPEALAERRYATPGRLVLAVDDPLGILPASLVLDVGADGTAGCEATTAEPELGLDVGALGSALFGRCPVAELARVGRAWELTPGALARADAMFRTAEIPWCPTMF